MSRGTHKKYRAGMMEVKIESLTVVVMGSWQ